MKIFIRVKERSYLIMELPTYRIPKWSNVGYTILEKTKAFVFEAGKVIMAISVILWVLASYGPGDTLKMPRANVIRGIEKFTIHRRRIGRSHCCLQAGTFLCGNDRKGRSNRDKTFRIRLEDRNCA